MDNLKSSSNITLLCMLDTIYNADSVEWCPNEPCQHIFVCANYHLIEDKNNSENSHRIGNIRLFSWNEERGTDLYQVIETDGVLDQKWCHNTINDYPILGVVTAKNKLEIYRLDIEKIQLNFVTSIDNGETNVLMLSLDWSTGKYSSETPEIIVSDSDGQVSVFSFKDNQLEHKFTWKAHEFEAWICAFYYWNISMVFTGGDDAKLLMFDTRIGNKPVIVKKNHTSGVTAIHSNKYKENIIATGSYDSSLLLWDIRNMKNPLISSEMKDSVWRLKWNPNDANFLLAACMRGGFHICEITNTDELNVVCSYYEHKDIAYGADWKYLNSEIYSGINFIGACSFYDQKLSIAKVDLRNIAL